MKKSLLFVDHSYHKITRSSDFFLEILSKEYEVCHRFVDPDRPLPFSKELVKGIDVVVVWQMDHLALLFLALGIPTIVIPMYDGSVGLPTAHWKLLRGAKFINFSYSLHAKVAAHGCDSLLVRYFPEPCQREIKFDRFNCFFWQRRPDHGLHWMLLNHLIGDSLSSLHIHDAPDIPDFKLELPAENRLNYSTTVSNWFESKAEMRGVMRQANVYFAPRLTEGIGMGFLEAMADGMIVIAPNMPTHNEYIAHGVNGYLYDNENPTPINLSPAEATRISGAAMGTVKHGRDEWTSSHESILNFIGSALPTTYKYTAAITPRFFARYFSSYTGGAGTYASFLNDNSYFFDELFEEGSSSKVNITRNSGQSAISLPSLNAINRDEVMSFGKDGSANRFMFSGWVNNEQDFSIIREGGGGLLITLSDDFIGNRLSFHLKARGIDHVTQGRVGLRVCVNGRESAIQKLGTEIEEYSFEIQLEAANATNAPLFVNLKSCVPEAEAIGGSNKSSICIYSLTVSESGRL